MNLNDLSKFTHNEIIEMLIFCENLIRIPNSIDSIIYVKQQAKYKNLSMKKIGKDQANNKFYIPKNYNWSEVKREELKFED